MSQLEKIGFIGLGHMGSPIALRLLKAGYPMTVLDLDKERMGVSVGEGARAASSPGEVAQHSNIVITSLQAEAVEEVACGTQGLTSANKADLNLIDLSSTSPEMAVKLSDTLRKHGIEMLDAPVSGADIGAMNGRLTVFVGGRHEAYQRCLPVLKHIGRTVTYLGKSGNGQVAKRINQMMQALSELAIHEGLTLAREKDLDLSMFAKAVSAGCAGSWRLEELVDNVLNKGEKKYKLKIRSGRTGNALKMAEQLGITLQGAEAAHRVFSEKDWNILIEFDK